MRACMYLFVGGVLVLSHVLEAHILLYQGHREEPCLCCIEESREDQLVDAELRLPEDRAIVLKSLL